MTIAGFDWKNSIINCWKKTGGWNSRWIESQGFESESPTQGAFNATFFWRPTSNPKNTRSIMGGPLWLWDSPWKSTKLTPPTKNHFQVWDQFFWGGPWWSLLLSPIACQLVAEVVQDEPCSLTSLQRTDTSHLIHSCLGELLVEESGWANECV